MTARKHALPRRHRPGSSWRILWHEFRGKGKMNGPGHHTQSGEFGPSEFDELVIDSWLHVEQMDDRDWMIYLARQDGTGVMVNVHVGEYGLAKSIMIEEDS